MARTASPPEPRSGSDNLYATLAAGFPADRAACAIEALRPGSTPLFYSWQDIDDATGKLANLLASLRLSPGARIAVQVDKSPEALLLYLACLRTGCVYLPLNTAYQAGEIDYFLGNAEPEVLVSTPASESWIGAIASRPRRRPSFHAGRRQPYRHLHARTRATAACSPSPAASRCLRDRRPRHEDLAAILYTSGTTGRSKGAMLSHGNLASNARTLDVYWRWRRSDVLLHALPIFHVHGLFVAAHGALLAGAKTIWTNRFDADQVIAALPRATVFMGVPTMYVRLLDRPAFDHDCCKRMRLFVSGSAPLLADTFRQFETRTGQRILERYGMSETVMLTSNPYDGNRVAGTVGLPLPGVEVRIVAEDGTACGTGEIGGIEVRGPGVFAGYWRMPEKTREEFTADGFFRTGDVGQWDANRYLSIVGRSKDLIISGGYNIYPKEIESYLDALPGVLESAVVGIPDRDFGEAVAAVIVPAPGTTLEPAEIIAALKARIAGFKVPRQVRIVRELPRNQMGKVQKTLLRTSFETASRS